MEDLPSESLTADGVLQDSLDHQGMDRDQSLDQEKSAPCQNQNQDQDLDCHAGSDWDQDQNHHQDQPQDQNRDQNHHQDQGQDQDQGSNSANQDAAVESAGSVPALVITQAEEPAETPAAAPEPADPAEPSVSAEADMACSDLLSLRSDTLSLAGDQGPSRTSEDDDSTSVTASSVISLFQRVQLDPLEKEWLRSSALGDGATQRRLLRQDAGLLMKKTALHWAAKQGRLETVDMMLLSGADVNVRSVSTQGPASGIITAGRLLTTGAAAGTCLRGRTLSQV
ncbi:uncharacterized protein LOC142889991 isoform X2 [Nelusetta ayraudi]|uniref:uncharacterized protein LOC142889991 isoform X2 n=1 Tax=Nelusetta ayraudi TaxID=303726 RepID=UPI003F726E0B